MSGKLKQTTLNFGPVQQQTQRKRKMESDKPDGDQDDKKSKYFSVEKGTSNADAMSRNYKSNDKITNNGSDSSGDDDVQEFPLTSSGMAGSKQGASGQEGENVPRETSPDLFDSQEGGNHSGTTSGTNSENWSQWEKVETDIPTGKPDEGEGGLETLGVPIEELKRAPKCLENLGKLTPTETHCVMVRLPFTYKEDQLPHPHPTHFHDKWDGDHVRMPCSNQNEYPVQGKEGKTIIPRWKLIQDALRAKISGPYELEETILKYNQRYEKKWSFQALVYFFTEYCAPDERNKFFDDTLPKIAKLALQLPHLCTSPIPLLKRPVDDWGSKGKEDKGKTARPRPNTITMSQQQVACLLANAFFCTFPRRNAKQARSEYSAYPSINFNTLYGGEPTSRKMEKLKCIVHYFERITEKMPAGLVTFTRQHIRKMPNWDGLDINLSELHVSSGGTIEDDGLGMLQVDFANKFIGGGALSSGLVQEEIRFMICPEMIVTRLFTEVLDKHESVIMTGCERFSNYSGYSDSFQWSGNHVDETERDTWGRLCCEVVAIDALVITNYGSQFSSYSVRRELNKAYAGFWSSRPKTELSAVCTGNWGCGAFGGDKQLKALIQLMAAACAKRDVCYFTFGNKELVQELFSIHTFLTQENPLAIGNIMRMIEQYHNGVVSKSWQKPTLKLFDFIIRHFENPGGSPTTEEEWSNSSEERVLMSEKERKAADEAKSIHAATDQSTQEMMANTP